MTRIIESIDSVVATGSSGLAYKSEQDLTELLRECREERAINDIQRGRMGRDHVRIARVPEAVVNKWMREGFNIYDPNVKPKDILKRLHDEGMDGFITHGGKF